MADLRILQDVDTGEQFFPYTHEDAVVDKNGKSAIASIKSDLSELTEDIATANNIITVNESDIVDINSNNITVTVTDNGFVLTRGKTSGAFSVGLLIDTIPDTSYSLSFNLVSGTLSACGVANNFEYPNAPTYVPTAKLVTFDTSIGAKNGIFTATGYQSFIYFTVAYDETDGISVDDVFCVESGSQLYKIKISALPDDIVSGAVGGASVVGNFTYASSASDFTNPCVYLMDGTLTTLNQRPSTELIDVSNITEIRFKLYELRNSDTDRTNYLTFLDENGDYLSGLVSSKTGVVEGIVGIPSGTKYALGNWYNGSTETPYMIGINADAVNTKLTDLDTKHGFNIDASTAVVNGTMNMEEFATAINSAFETYSVSCGCKNYSFLNISQYDSWEYICELINKNFRKDVVNSAFSFEKSCNEINKAFAEKIYRFMDAKVSTGNSCDFSLSTGLFGGEPSAIVSDDGSTLYVYAYQKRVCTTDGVNWFPSENVSITGELQTLIHSNYNIIDGTFYMVGTSGTVGGLWLAKSTDGLNYTLVRKLFDDGYEFSSDDGVTAWGNTYLIKDYGTGLFYLYIEYRGDTSTDYGWKISVVTTNDIENGEFTNYSANPILTNVWETLDGSAYTAAGNPDFAKGMDNRPVRVDGKYYMYFHSTHNSKSNILRASSSDLINWDIDGIMLDNRDTPTLGDDTSGNADHCIIEFKGRTYLFYTWNINADDSDIWIKYTIDDRPIREMLKLRP